MILFHNDYFMLSELLSETHNGRTVFLAIPQRSDAYLPKSIKSLIATREKGRKKEEKGELETFANADFLVRLPDLACNTAGHTLYLAVSLR